MNKRLLIILLIGFTINLAILFSIPEVKIVYDEADYNNLAKNILEGKGYISPYGKPTSMRPPLYPVFLAGTYTLFGVDNYRMVWFVQIILHLITGIIVYKTGETLFKPSVGMLASILYIFYPSLIGFNFLLMSEILFNFLFALSICFFAYFLKKESSGYLIASGIAFGLSALTRSVGWPIVILLTVFLVIVGFIERQFIIKSLMKGVLFLCFFLLTVSPWVYRNTQVQGSFTLIDTMGGMNFMMGNYEHTPLNRSWAAVELKGKKNWGHRLHIEYSGKHLTENEKQRWATKQAIRFMIENPLLTLKRSIIKTFDFWGQERVVVASLSENHWGDAKNIFVGILAGLIVLFYTLIFVSASFGWGYAIGTTRVIAIFIGLIVIGITLIHAIVFGHSRYHLPLIPLMTILSAVTFINCYDVKKYFMENKKAFLLCCCWILFVTIGWIRSILFVDTDKILKILS